MDKDTINSKLREIIIKTLEAKVEPNDIIGKDLILELGINSIDALEIFVWVENTFEIQIDDEDLNADLIKDLDKLTCYIQSKLLGN